MTAATTTPGTTSAEVTRYLDQVRALLVNLPADEREELLGDLAVHLHEVRVETNEPLEQALGTPAAFVTELLASSGHPSVAPRSSRWPTVPGTARQRWEHLQRSAAWRWMQALRPELVPGWWVLRGYLGVLVVSELMNGVLGDDFPIPSLFGSKVVGLAAAVAAMVGSVHLGRRGLQGWRPRWVRLLDIAVVVGALWGALIAFDSRATEYVYVESAHDSSPGALTHPDGSGITNLFVYDADGRLLDDVLIYDQEGTPVLVAPDDGLTIYTDDGVPLETDHRLDVNGAQVRNVYPLDQRVGWPGGIEEAPVPPPAITTPRLAPDTDTDAVDGPTTSSPSTTSSSTTSPATTSTTSPPPPAEIESPAPAEPAPPSSD